MAIQRIQTGPRMSQAVIHNKTVYLAGQVAAGATVTIQAREILAGIDALLKEANTDKSRLAVGDHLAHRHGDLRGNERGVAGLGGAGLDPGARHGDEFASGVHRIQDRNRRRGRATLRRRGRWTRTPRMLELQNISKTFEDRTVLDDVSLSFPKGATHALIGSSGSGKTTLLRITLGSDSLRPRLRQDQRSGAAVVHPGRVGRPHRLCAAGRRTVPAHLGHEQCGLDREAAGLAQGADRGSGGGAAQDRGSGSGDPDAFSARDERRPEAAGVDHAGRDDGSGGDAARRTDGRASIP